MARIRSVHPGLFTDEAFVSLSMTARVLYIGIWTEADDHGVFEWKPLQFKMRLMPADTADVSALMDEMARCNSVKRFTSEDKSYGLVRNFCKYQRPKKPKYTHFMPQELRTYAGLKEDGSLPVLHQSGTGSQNHPQREDGGGEGDEESGIKKRGESNSRADLKLVSEEKPIPINESYEPSDRAIEYAYSLGMKKADLNSELSKFIALSMASKATSYNPDMSFKAFCDRWLDFKRQKNPDWKPEPEPVATPVVDRSAWPIIVEGTLEHTCWNADNREKGFRPLFLCKQIAKDGTLYERAARCPTPFPPGYNDFGEKLPPASDGEERVA